MKRLTTFLLTLLLFTLGASAQSLEGEYLIVDAEGNYLGGGLTWGTQAAIIGKPQFIGFEVQEDGTYHLDSHQYNNATSHYLGSNLYFDSTPVDWTIAAAEGGYTIHGTVDDGTGYLTSNGFQTVPTVEADPYVWTLLSMDDVVASMDGATADAPVDVTALIAAPELKRNINTSYHPTWTVTGYDGTGTPSNYAFGGGSAVANCAESYHSSNGFNFSQEVTLPKSGTYKLSAKGFYRDDHTDSTTLLLPVLYVDDQSVEFPELDTSANNMAEAYAEFLEGLHQIDAITFTTYRDGKTVTIGFKGEDIDLWNIMGELELLYCGEEEAEPENVYETVYECVAEFDHWSIAGNSSGSFQLNTWSTEDDPSGMVVPFIEYWVGTDNILPDATISHTQLEVDNGAYQVSVFARLFNEGSSILTDSPSEGVTFTVNGESVDMTTGTSGRYNLTSPEYYGTYAIETVVEDGKLDIGINVNGLTAGDWLAFKNLNVAVKTSTADIELTAVEGVMNAKVEEAQLDAIAKFEKTLTADSYYEAVAAIEAAAASVEQYAAMAAEIAEVVPDLDEDGAAVWEASDAKAAYEARTLDTADEVIADLVAAQKAQVTESSDMTYVALYEGYWTGNTGTYADGVEHYQDGNSGGACEAGKILYKTIEDLTPGTYTVSFYAVANMAWNDYATGDGIAQVFANETTEDVPVYAQTGCTPADYPHTLTCAVAKDGVLEFGLQNIATGGNWYVAQAISLTLVEVAEIEPEDTPSDYVPGDVVTVDGVEYTVLSDNMVENHSFELGFTGWTAASDFTTEITSEKFALMTDGAEDGEQYLVGTTNSGSTSDGSLGKAWAIEANKTYYLFYWIKNLDGTEETDYLKTSLTNTPGDETEILGFPETVSADWQKVEYVFDSEDYEYVQVKFRWLENHWGFDNFQIYEVEAPEAEGETSHECEAEESHWTTTGTTGIGLNTWSVEADASGMVVPFLQLWVWSGDATQPSLEAATISHETLIMEPGTYDVSLDIRIFSEAGNEIGEGTTFNANDASADLLTEGSTGTYATDDYPNMTEVYGTYVLTCTVGDDGVLDININIPEGVDYNWIAFKNLSVTLVEEPEVEGETSHECVAEVDHWTIAGNTNGDFHYNDWSTEADASGMVVPFLEYWVWSGEGNLSAATISHETLIMEPGTYDVSLDIRIFSEAGNEIGEGTTLNANDASVDLAAAGTADVYGTETEVYGTYVLTCTVGSDGVLDININIPEGVDYNWIAFKNLSVTIAEEPEVTGTYEFVATDWVASDNGRVTASGITYNDDNTITVVASGANNVALGNNPSQAWGTPWDVTTAEYTITEDQIYFTVIATDISTESGASYLWWMNGWNEGSQIAPDKTEVFVDEDGNENGVVLVAWDISAYVTADEDGLVTLNGGTCFGLTSTTGTSVISDINFYTATELNGVVTAIGSVKADNEPAAAEGIYTLSGVRLNKITKSGIYIVDGKKVLVK